MPLNDAAANTEGGRLSRMMANCDQYRAFSANSVFTSSCDSCGPANTVQSPITPSESNRIIALTAIINNTLVNGGCVTQSRAKQLIAAAAISQNYGSEGVRIAALQQATLAASDDSPFLVPIIIQDPIPYFPPPPAPPLGDCFPLTKNMKF